MSNKKQKITNRGTAHFVYILQCADDTLYTGYAIDAKKRVIEHNTGKAAAKYTRARRPVQLVYTEECDTRSAALKREAHIKKFSRKEKLLLIQKNSR